VKKRVYVTSSAEMRRLDEATIRDHGVPGLTLMERAGTAAADVALTMLSPGARVVVLAGPGNNGGDGYVVARRLAERGHEVHVYLLAPEAKTKGDARTNLDAWRSMGGAVIEAATASAFAAHRSDLRSCHLYVDALFGTGLSDEVRSPYREAIELMNREGHPVVSLDIPSGVDGDRGHVLGVAVRATATVTFGFPKRGHYLFPGADHVGRLSIADIGIPDAAVRAHEPRAVLLSDDEVESLLPQRPRDAHKGTFGHLLIVGGAAGKTGAALLAARAAHRSGVGLVTAAAPREGQRALDAKVVETMTESLGDEAGAGAARVLTLSSGKRALAIGPGLGQGEGANLLMRAVMVSARLPTVLDADALNALAVDPTPLKEARAPLVLTPHPGEMARLASVPLADVQADRFGVAERFAEEYGVTVVLKGAYTLIAEPSGRTWVNPTGNPGMATGGMGDVLTGVIGALLAQGLPAAEAARFGVYAHGLAGDLASERVGQVGLLASDVIDALPLVWRRWERR
jgi:NAD(P)H-hydrate epimerase